MPSSPDGNDGAVYPTEIGVDRLLDSLHYIRSKMNGQREEDFAFLLSMLQSSDFQSLMRVHVAVTRDQSPQPFGSAALPLLDDVVDMLEEIDDRESKALLDLFAAPHMRSLCMAHDRVAKKDFSRKSPEPIEEEPESAEQIVKIQKKRGQPLGATIRTDEVNRDIVINRVLYGTAAFGHLKPGDIVVELNGTLVKGRSLDDVVYMLERLNGSVKFKVFRGENTIPMETCIFVVAHFDYDPRTDTLCPCKEAGLEFHRGDVLKIVDQQDPKWWQARKEVNGGQTGIIPSKQLQERRMSMHRAEENRSVYKRPTRASWWKKWRSTRKPKKKLQQTTAEYSWSEMMTYEEVAKIEPARDKHRPVIIIGAPGVGRTTLKRFLLDNEPDKYSYPVPTTTRPRKASEVDGSDYNFMVKARMIEAIQQNQFVEFGEHKGNYYGTSLESIREVVDSGKIAVLTVHPQALHILKGTDLKPFVVFVKPPQFEQLRATRQTQLSESKSTKSLTDDDLWELMQESTRIYKLYSHYIDCAIVNDDVHEAYQELKQRIDRLEREPQWVPAVWVH